MSTLTANIDLVKPTGLEKYSLAIINANSDIIDTEITDAKAGSNTRIFKCKNDVSSIDNALNVQAGDGRYAKLAGLITQLFSVAPATADGHAVSRIFGDGRYAKLAGLATQVFNVATPSADAHATPKSYVDTQINANGNPVGTVIDFAGSIAPDGYLVCNGGVVSTTTYANLYAVLGVLWANTAGASTPLAGEFRLPPQQVGGLGLYVRGVGATNGIVGTYQADVFKSHVHSASHSHTGSTNSTGSHRHGTTMFGADYADGGRPVNGGNTISGTCYSDYQGTHSHTVTVNTATFDTASTGDATETRPRSITMLKCIKY